MPHNLVRGLKLCARDFIQVSDGLSHRALMCSIKLMCLYLVILFPQPVEAGAFVIGTQEMPYALNSIPDGWLGAVVKLSNSALRQFPNPFTDKHAERVLGCLSAVLVADVERDAATNNSTDNGEIWEYVGQAVFGFVLVLLPDLYADRQSRGDITRRISAQAQRPPLASRVECEGRVPNCHPAPSGEA